MEVFEALTIAIPIAVGAYFVLFSRRASLGMSRSQEKLLGRRYTDFEIRFAQILAVIVGAILLIGGLFMGVQRVIA